MINTDQLKNMFESIKDSLNSKQNDASYKNYLKTEPGKTYTVRILPNIKNPDETFYHYEHHGFTSESTGQYIDAFCLRVLEERCPICEHRMKLYKTKDANDRTKAYNIRTHEKHLANVYVIDDPGNPENNGTIKILRFSKSLFKKVVQATTGDAADEFGYKIYDLSDKGCNFKIAVEKTADKARDVKFISYDNSRFTIPCAIPGMTEEKMNEVYNGIFNLSETVEIKSAAEVDKILKQHIVCEIDDVNKNNATPGVIAKNETRAESVSEKVKTENAESAETAKSVTTREVKEDDMSNDIDEKLKDLLDGLDNI